MRIPFQSAVGFGIIESYANDAAFLAATGIVTPREGTFYFNSASNSYRIYSGGVWRPLSVSGPVSSTDEGIARYDGTGGSVLQNSNVVIDDTDVVRTPNSGVSDSNPTNPLNLSTGNKTAGTGDSGDLILGTGTSFGGAAGVVRLSPGGTPQVEVTSQSLMRLLNELETRYVDSGSNYVGIKAPNVVNSSYTIELPADPPSTNDVLTYTGAGYFWAPGGAGGGGWPTVFVDAGGSTPTIAAALALLPSTGGVICVVSDLTINSVTTVTLDNVQIISRNRAYQITFGASGGLTFNGNNGYVEDLRFTSTGKTSGTYLTINGSDFKCKSCEFTSAADTDANIYLRVYGSRSDHELCVFRRVVSPATNVGVQYESGSVGNTYRAPTSL